MNDNTVPPSYAETAQVISHAPETSDAFSFNRSAKLFAQNLNRGTAGATGGMIGQDRDAYLKSIQPKMRIPVFFDN